MSQTTWSVSNPQLPPWVDPAELYAIKEHSEESVRLRMGRRLPTESMLPGFFWTAKW